MLIGKNSEYLLKKTRAKSKMYEYGVPLEDHVSVEKNVSDLFLIAIGAIGAISNEIWNKNGLMSVIEVENYELKFASSFFDSFIHSRIDKQNDNDDYYALLGSVAYYFSDMIGSSKVMLKRIDPELNIGCDGIENVIVAMLNDNLEHLNLKTIEGNHFIFLNKLIESYKSYFSRNELIHFEDFNKYKQYIYDSGTPRELLFSDVLLAIFVKKVSNSALNLLPKFSGLPSNLWEEFLLEKNGIKELWPAQMKLGESGFFLGKSGVIQMPTSSGKTTSIALVIRSAFLAKRTALTIVVAPFRALCKEISTDLSNYFKSDSKVLINEFSDIPDTNDLSIFHNIEDNKKYIMVLTPEKLIHLLRNDMSILEVLGLIIFDEAHLFDDGSRGIDYELLISTIKHYIPKDSQKILISAVIPNAAEINKWLNGEEGVYISDNSIKSANKTIAIGDWNGRGGQLYFINPDNPDVEEFFVPRVVDIKQIDKLGSERKDRYFPEVDFSKSKVNNNDMSIYYALKLINNGGIAIFCGKKDSADNILTRILDLENRGINISSIEKKARNNENKKIANLVSANLGEDNTYYKTALKGVVIHHAGIPNSLRISAEYAVSQDLVGCIVCTSTLAQGVNLPIRYLIISSIYQAGEKIKVRDFHNLIGRTGRAGKHTEGTVILSEPFVYSRRSDRDNQWRWENYKNTLNPENSESCKSNLLKLVQTVTIHSRTCPKSSLILPFEQLIKLRYENYGEYKETIQRWRHQFDEEAYPEYFLLNFEKELSIFENSMSAVESYILSFMSDGQYSLEGDIKNIVQNTLGYSLANADEKIALETLFTNIEHFVFDFPKNDIEDYKKTSMGAFSSRDLKEWVEQNLYNFINCKNVTELVSILMPKLISLSANKTIKKILDQSEITKLAILWISGESYSKILNYCEQSEVKIIRRKQERTINLSEIIDFCDNGLGYSTTFIINAVETFIKSFDDEYDNLPINQLNLLSKQLRYGLPRISTVNIYELGFSDRVICQDIENALSGINLTTKTRCKRAIKRNKSLVKEIILPYPSYFTELLNTL